MIATMRGACLVGVLVIVIGCLTETRAYVSFDQVNPGNSSVSDDDLLKSTVPEQEAKAETEKPKLTRVPLEPRKSRRAIDGSLRTINKNDGGKPGRISIKERPVSKDVAPKARPAAKRNHKKMKLALTQKKSKKTKRYIHTAATQQLLSNQNRSETENSNRYKTKYYAQRKSIMDRFYARNREIRRKYQPRTSTSATMTTTTDGPVRYFLDFERSPTKTRGDFVKEAKVKPPIATPPPQVPASTSSSTRTISEANGDAERSKVDYDKIGEHSSTESATTIEHANARRAIPKTTTPHAPPIDGKIHKEGNCEKLESLDEVYQHNLVLDIERSTTVETQILSPTVEGSCIDCVIAHQISGPSQKINILKSAKTVTIKVEGLTSGPITITTKFYANSTTGGHC